MSNVRLYGSKPYRVALIHGGPGGAGEMASVAQELSSTHGIIEPFQTQHTIEALIIELKDILDTHATLPIILIGYSWGAWLAWLFAAQYPAYVKKLILISSGPFEEKYVSQIAQNRIARLSQPEAEEFISIRNQLIQQNHLSGEAIKRLETLCKKADAFNPIDEDNNYPQIPGQETMYQDIWPQAAALRSSGKLLALAQKIISPVVAIHGKYDPHPAAGVKEPLSATLNTRLTFHVLENCGHCPWLEKKARKNFYNLIRNEL